ncbi:MAG: glycosyltransferase family 4 protein [Clostridiales bacterium]|jgi:glycosyltransferase involved in cell wall biosynthesis|nr:glycosyltransferase family 4 protein [Clostridiales bacterium]
MNNRRNRYRILYIITQGILGGAQTHIRHLCENLKEDFDIHVAVGVYGPLVDNLSNEGIEVHVVPSLVRPISFWKDVSAVRELVDLIHSLQPDLISTHSSKAGILGRLSAKICGVPVIFTAHGWAFTEGVPPTKRKIYIFAERLAAKWAKRIICVSDYDRRLALHYGVTSSDKIITIHNGMPLLKNIVAENLYKKNNQVEFLMVARFTQPKDHELLLRTISRLNSTNGYIFTFVGDGELLDKAKKLSVELGIENKVCFLGAREDVPELLNRVDAFVLTSKWEGLPRSIIEAMRAGLPVIASDVGGVSELVEEGITGYLVPRDDADTLKDRLETLIDNSQLRLQMGMAGYQRFIDKFTFERMLKETVEVYEEALQKHGN